ncbi:MAG: RagB/SusD family nutrient uptake outer membrane protein [Gemmatimonadetes bacterium]|nr:RagB/SusD family nutrient uptake outer membrane protein [Gemmatimonadota bacterium]
MKDHDKQRSRPRWGVYVIAAATLVGCDTSVTNPGPVQDEFLDSLIAHVAVVRGSSRDLSDALDQIAYWGAAITYEINPAGSTGSFGIPTSVQDGRFETDFSADWNRISRAVWTAENALVRFDSVLPLIDGAPSFGSYEPAAGAALLAGYATRVMGENFCQVAFGGGDLQEFEAALTRSEAHFTQAIDIGTAAGNSEIATAARAGRASVRAYLATYGMASWSDAAADAAAVTDNDFVHVAVYSEQDDGQSNFVMMAAPGTGTYRAHTVWATFYENYFTTTGDPRTPWTFDPEIPVGDAAVSKFGGNVDFFPQAKYVVQEAPINLSSGWEMRLIEAEAILNGAGSGDFNDAVTLMNQRRSDLSLTPIAAASTAEAYTALKLERALELWLEARRLGDIRRWDANNVSGGISDVTDGIYNGPGGTFNATMTTLATNDRCWPIGEDERETNTNF